MNSTRENPTGSPPRLTVVVPALNEVRRLPPTIDRIAGYLGGQPRWLPAEILVVDDGSRDGTADRVRTIQPPPGVSLTVLSHTVNQGKGAAVRTGFAASSGRHLLLCDADLATPIEDLEVLSAGGLRRVVRIGSRAAGRHLIEVRQPRHRDAMGRLFNLLVRVTALPGIGDTQCGFKLFPGHLGRALAGVQRLDGFAFDVELLLVARRWGFEICEVPVRWRHVEASRVHPLNHSAEMLRDLLGLCRRRVFGRLPAKPPTLDRETADESEA